MDINWFPGHMAKTRRIIQENIKLVDVIIELLDARIPASSRNPEIDLLAKNKPRVVAFNKSDLSDEKINREWKNWYNEKGYTCIFIDSVRGTGFKEVKESLFKAVKEKVDRERQKGRISKTIRTMVVGIPNVGKSSFINKFTGRAATVTGDKPGVTRGKQWVRIDGDIELLDTPGILWPKFEDPIVGYRLAFTGAIKDDILDLIEIASSLLDVLKLSYPNNLSERYKIEIKKDESGLVMLESIGKKRGCIMSGGKVDLLRAAIILFDEFRGGKLGRISLERPSDILKPGLNQKN